MRTPENVLIERPGARKVGHDVYRIDGVLFSCREQDNPFFGCGREFIVGVPIRDVVKARPTIQAIVDEFGVFVRMTDGKYGRYFAWKIPERPQA